jgi:butyrate kinase
MINDIKAGRMLGEHISNIGAILAKGVAEKFGVSAFISDPVSVDEFEDIARVSGIPEIRRDALQHTLNMKSTARLAAVEMNKNVEDLQLVIAHLGSGISVCPMKNGRLIDTNNATQEGPFSPQRSGGLPVNHLVDLCFSGKYDRKWIKKRLVGNGGLVAYIGTSDMRQIEERIKSNDSEAKFYLEALAYQVSKEIGAMATVLKGKVDVIILTGGCAYSEILNEMIVDRVKYIAPIKIYPGEREMLALAEAVLRVLEGKEEVKPYPY